MRESLYRLKKVKKRAEELYNMHPSIYAIGAAKNLHFSNSSAVGRFS
jgi:hypothetical protein